MVDAAHPWDRAPGSAVGAWVAFPSRVCGDTRTVRWQGSAAALLLLVSACSSGIDQRGAAEPGVVVASFNFTESHLLAEIYAQALEDEGVVVRRELGLGQRELVLPAMRSGFVDIVPEYAGSALDAVAPGSDVELHDVDAVVQALEVALEPWGMTVLTPARASNQNVVAVRADMAEARGLDSVSDLAPFAGEMLLGGPPECPRRPRCLPGLADRYGLEFEAFEPFGDAALVHRALVDGVVDVGVLFSTDAALTDGDVVVLDDDRELQPPDQVVPMVRGEVLDDDRVRVALEQVSARLTTDSLRFLSWRLAFAGSSLAAEARGWLVRRGLVER